MRVYHIKIPATKLYNSSLIICEGISVQAGKAHELSEVPSLYVRVYRGFPGEMLAGRGSLIICEGISAVGQNKALEQMFPHYM